MTGPAGYEYDVALSFAGEDRPYVEAVAGRLRTAGLKVFFDDFEQIELWGGDLVVHLDEVYRTKARYCVVFISRHYRHKLWTTHELQSALARAVTERDAYLLPARFDDTEIPGVRPTVHYIDLRRLPPEQFANLITEKVRGTRPPPPTAAPPATPRYRMPRVARRDFNPYQEAQRLIDHLANGLDQRCATVADGGVGVSFSRFDRDGRTCLRIVLDSQPRYGVDVWMGGMSGDSSLAFARSRGESRYSSGGMHAWGEIIWSKVHNAPTLKLFNLSLLGRMGNDVELTYDEMLEELWADACKALEEDQW